MRVPLLLYSYLAGEILAPFFASLVILTSVIFLGRIVPMLDILFAYGINFPDFIRLCAYLAPQLLLFSLPMASMTGVILGFTRMATEHELMAFKACGTGIYRMLPPVIIMALSAALLTSAFSARLIPAGNMAMERLFFKLAKEKIDRGLRQKRFSEGLGSVVLYADRIDPANDEWQGVYISDKRDRQAPATIMATRGVMTTDPQAMSVTLSLKDGSLHRMAGETSQEIRFAAYTLNLGLRPPPALSGPPLKKRSLTMQQLLAEARKSGADSDLGINLLIEYHQRLVLAAGCLILTLLGLPLGFLATPGRRAPGIPLGLGLFLLYYVLISAAKTLSEGRLLAVGPAMWIPNLLFGLLVLFLLKSVARETFYIHVDRLRSLSGRLIDLIPIRRRPPTASLELHGDEATGLFHRPGCMDYKPTGPGKTFASPGEASQNGFTPCGLCNPSGIKD